MGALKEHHMDRAAANVFNTQRRLQALLLKLRECDELSDAVRDYTRTVFSSDEPYEHSKALSNRLSAAIAIVELMLEDHQ